MVEPIILPVVRIEREAVARPDVLPAAVTDINEFRHARTRLAVERRALQSLLPCDCGDG